MRNDQVHVQQDPGVPEDGVGADPPAVHPGAEPELDAESHQADRVQHSREAEDVVGFVQGQNSAVGVAVFVVDSVRCFSGAPRRGVGRTRRSKTFRRDTNTGDETTRWRVSTGQVRWRLEAHSMLPGSQKYSQV